MSTISGIIGKIPIRFKYWMTQEEWPLWLWLVDAFEECAPSKLHEDPKYKHSELPLGTNSNEMLPCMP